MHKTILRKLESISFLFLVALFAATLSPAQDPGAWPRQITKPGGTIVLYQPQVDDWENYQQVDARMAFSLTPTGGKSQVGVITVQLKSAVNMDDHTVLLSDPQITSVTFPSLDPATAAQLEQTVRTFLNPAATMTISLDRLVASVKKTKAPPVADVNNTPPTIFVSMRPAILLLVNGSPTLAPIASSNLQFVVNANWPVFVEQGSSTYYLFDGKGWLSCASLGGTWTPTSQLPKQMKKVPENANFASLKEFIPPPPGSAASSPMVYYSATPAEIVVFGGRPQWTPIPGTQLSYASNTDSTVFKYTPTGAFYYLTSGRWFTTTTPLLGGWTFATYTLPPDFAQIPASNPAGKVLASVPGTPEAEDAVLIAQVPTAVTVNAAQAPSEVKVSYVGAPQFAPIEGTTLLYATNTPNKVIQVGNEYYLCYQGVWFVSFSAQGPWQTAQTVPQVIYTIPPSSPVYNVTYVTQVVATDGYVTASYTAGYMGMFVAGAAVGAIVTCGTGYYYPPYVYGGFYYPYAATYGYHTYNPYTGAYGYGGAAYGPYGSAHWGTSYNPNTGTYARGATASTAYGTQSVGQAYNPYTGAYGATHQGSNAYGSWGQSVVSKNGNTAYTQHATNAYGSAGTVQTSAGGKGAATSTAYGNTAAGKTSNGDMYAGHDGNVYKNTGSGWQKYDNGSWNDVQKPTTTSAQSYNQQHPTSSNSNYSSAQQKAQSNPNYSADQQKAQSNPNYSADQQKAQSNAQQHSSGSSTYKPSSGSSDVDKEAQDRSRGAQQSQRFSQYQHSSGGGDRWGGASRGGGGYGGRR
ncbi:MAG: hypothetical protein WAL85_05650 [Candidatus Korobacteraceae bacterium]